MDNFDLISADELRQLQSAAGIKRIAQRQFDDFFRRQLRQFTLQRRARNERGMDIMASARQPICQIGEMSFSAAQRARRTYLQDSHLRLPVPARSNLAQTAKMQDEFELHDRL